jgi:hypothetical protein
MTAALAPARDADQAYRTARQVRLDSPRSHVHRLVSSAFTPGVGWNYRTRCGAVLSASRYGALLTTRAVDCPGCTPGWKAE